MPPASWLLFESTEIIIQVERQTDSDDDDES